MGKPVIRARYEFAEAGAPRLADTIDRFLDTRPAGG
jgi:predicted GTPase